MSLFINDLKFLQAPCRSIHLQCVIFFGVNEIKTSKPNIKRDQSKEQVWRQHNVHRLQIAFNIILNNSHKKKS